MDVLSALRGRRVLVTGTTGFLGARFAEHGEALGVHVVRMHRGDGAAGDDHVAADLRDADQVRRAVERARPEGVMHLAAAGVSAGSLTLPELLHANAVGTANLFEALEPLGPIPVVMAGTAYEYRMEDRPLDEEQPLAPPTAYGVSKAAASLCAGWYARRRPVTILRLFNVYGVGEPLPRLIPAIIAASREGRPVELSACTQVRDYVYVEDVARLFWLALANPPEIGAPRIVNVGSGQPAPLRRYVDALADALREAGMEPDLRIGARPTRPGEPMLLAGDLTRLSRTFDWAPSTDFETGIRRTIGARQ